MLEINNKVQITAIGWHPARHSCWWTSINPSWCYPTQNLFKQKPNNDQITGRQSAVLLKPTTAFWKKANRLKVGFAITLAALQDGHLAEREYQKLLKESGIPLLSVVPESRAAFMQAKGR